MTTLLPWSSIEIGDLDIFTPSPPCLLVHTSYIDGEPESSVTYFWQDEDTGLLNHEVLFLKPVSFDEALTWAQEHAEDKSIERIHVKHGRAAAVAAPTTKKMTAAAKGRGRKKAGAAKRMARKTPTAKRRRKRAA